MVIWSDGRLGPDCCNEWNTRQVSTYDTVAASNALHWFLRVSFWFHNVCSHGRNNHAKILALLSGRTAV